MYNNPILLQRLESRGKMAELWRFIYDLVSAKVFSFAENFLNAFDDIIDVALRIHPSRNRKTDQFHRRWNMFPVRVILPEHDAPNLDRANTSDRIQFRHDRLAGELFLRDMRKKSFCVDVNRMTARRLKNRNPYLGQFISQILDRASR